MKKTKMKFKFELKKPSLRTVLVFCGIIFPMAALFAFNLFHATAVYRGTEAVFAIYGYDPRDLLSGHYLTFDIDLGAKGSCRDVSYDRSYNSRPKQIFFCIDTKNFVKSQRECPSASIGGYCDYRDFYTGVRRFYIPEKYAETLDFQLRQSTRTTQRMKVVLSVTGSGRAYAKDILIDGRPWKEWIQKPVVTEDAQTDSAVEVLEENGEKIILKAPEE